MSTGFEDDGRSAASRLSVIRVSVVTAVSASVLYILCWIGAVTGLIPATHMYLRLFSMADQTSNTALIEGAISSMAFGILAGAILTTTYNAFAFLDRR